MRGQAEVSVAALDARAKAKMQGYEGDPCGECGNFTLVRNGTCMKCNTCGGDERLQLTISGGLRQEPVEQDQTTNAGRSGRRGAAGPLRAFRARATIRG